MFPPVDSTDERLKELKDTYAKLFSEQNRCHHRFFPSDDLLNYRHFSPHQGTSRNPQDEEMGHGLGRGFSQRENKYWGTPIKSAPPKLRLRPLLEDLNKKGPADRKNFMIQRMDQLSVGRPTKVMDYVRKQYPTADDNANTFFLLGDVHKCIREYLTSNGWIEKFSAHEERAHLVRSLQGLPSGDNKTLGRLLSADPVKFIWVNGFINWSLISNNVIVSRIPSSSYYFSKTALASSIRDLFPFLYQKGFIDVQTPRTYEVRMPEDMKHFLKQYRINACISLIRKFVSSFDSALKTQLMSEDGTVPLDCLDFAVQRIVEVIRFYQHADIDEWHFSVVSDEDWGVFLFRFYDITHQDAKFQSKHHNISVPKLAYACEKLCLTFEKYFPDSKHDGHRNLWIVKPANGSCGRGVKVFKRLPEIQQYCKSTSSYVIQKYIEVPLLIHQTKFDIRQWFLITSVYPLIIWMYEECYLRFCSQQFSLTNVHESVHLCNNSVQYKYKNGIRSPQLPDDNMWDDRSFQQFLCERDVGHVWPEMKNKMQQAIIASCLVSQDKMYHRTNSFHLYGADFMITPDFGVWLIEINTHPSMKYSTNVTSRMCKEVLQDTLKVGLDRRANPHADTGKFTEIYRQLSHQPTVGVPASAAGVQARKIRLVNQSLKKEPGPSSVFEETLKPPSKFNKWISYTNIATYKKHNKVNFKYVVLRHTDMPLDPGDSINIRDIGYAGVLDKMNLNEGTSEGSEDLNKEEEEEPVKEKEDMQAAKTPPKPVNQSTLHRTVISKLKAKEKTSAEKKGAEEDTEACPSKNSGNIKGRSETPNTNPPSSGGKQKVSSPHAEMGTIHNKSTHVENLLEVRSVPEIMGLNAVPFEKDMHKEKRAASKSSKSPENNVSSKKTVSSEELSSQDREKKNINSQRVATQGKGENTKKLANPEVIHSKSNLNSHKSTNSKNEVNKKNAINSQRKGTAMNKSIERKAAKKVYDSKMVVRGEKGKSTKHFKEYHTKIHNPYVDQRRSVNNILSKNSPKTNVSKHKVSAIKLIKKPSSGVEKFFSDKSRTESINFINISQKERENFLIKNQGNKTTKEKKLSSKNRFSSRSLSKVSSTSSAHKTKAFNDVGTQHSNKNYGYKGGLSLNILKSRPRSKRKSTCTRVERKRTSRLKPTSDSTRKVIFSRQVFNPEGTDESDDHSRSGNRRKYVLPETLQVNDIQEPFIPQNVIFMLTDSETSFKTAVSDSEEESLSDEESTSEEQTKSIESATYNVQKNLVREGKLMSSSIKRYSNRNKYCE